MYAGVPNSSASCETGIPAIWERVTGKLETVGIRCCPFAHNLAEFGKRTTPEGIGSLLRTLGPVNQICAANKHRPQDKQPNQGTNSEASRAAAVLRVSWHGARHSQASAKTSDRGR